MCIPWFDVAFAFNDFFCTRARICFGNGYISDIYWFRNICYRHLLVAHSKVTGFGRKRFHYWWGRSQATPGRWVMVPNFLPVRVWFADLENFYFLGNLYQWTNHNLYSMDVLRVSSISKCKQSIVSMCCPWSQNTAFTAMFTTSCIWFGKTLMATYVLDSSCLFCGHI